MKPQGNLWTARARWWERMIIPHSNGAGIGLGQLVIAWNRLRPSATVPGKVASENIDC